MWPAYTHPISLITFLPMLHYYLRLAKLPLLLLALIIAGYYAYTLYTTTPESNDVPAIVHDNLFAAREDKGTLYLTAATVDEPNTLRSYTIDLNTQELTKLFPNWPIIQPYPVTDDIYIGLGLNDDATTTNDALLPLTINHTTDELVSVLDSITYYNELDVQTDVSGRYLVYAGTKEELSGAPLIDPNNWFVHIYDNETAISYEINRAFSPAWYEVRGLVRRT